jgi:hypothetical protein
MTLATVSVLLLTTMASAAALLFFVRPSGAPSPMVFDRLEVRDPGGRVLRTLSRKQGDGEVLTQIGTYTRHPITAAAPIDAVNQAYPITANSSLSWRYHPDGYFYQLDYTLSRMYRIDDTATFEALLFGTPLPSPATPPTD